MSRRNFVPAKGARLLRRVAKHILAEPRRYEQNAIVSVGQPKTAFAAGHKFPACGTVACIGGWLTLLTDKLWAKHPSERYALHSLDYGELAASLGVSEHSVAFLFPYTKGHERTWPEPFNSRYNHAKTPKMRAKIAVARIEHFIKTGE